MLLQNLLEKIFPNISRKKQARLDTAFKSPVDANAMRPVYGGSTARAYLRGDETIERITTMAITAKFSAGSGLLSVTGDNIDNTIIASRDAAGNILINNGAVPVVGGSPTVANTAEIDIFGQNGNDTIALDESNGALPSAHLFGGNGNDVLTGGSSADLLFGQNGDDTLLGKGGDDQLFGGNGNDVLTGGAGSDQVFGQNGNDRMIWNPGDGSDLFEGGNGTDTAEVNGGNGVETFTIAANGGRVQFDRVSPAPFSIDIGTTENLVLNANGGDDIIIAGNGLAGLIQLTLDGGAGNDQITGGDGNDVIIGGTGSDLALMGAGDDTFVWNQGDGSDTVEGQSGADTLRFNGFSANENFDISANGSRARLSRDLGNIVMDVNGTETIDLHAQGGADTITVNDLAGTDVSNVNLDLGGADGQVDTVVINTTDGDDAISFTSDKGVVTVSGLAAEVTISNFEADDRLVINGVGVPLGSVAQSAALLSQFMASSFVTAADGQGEAPITDQPATQQQPLLTQPQA